MSPERTLKKQKRRSEKAEKVQAVAGELVEKDTVSKIESIALTVAKVALAIARFVKVFL